MKYICQTYFTVIKKKKSNIYLFSYLLVPVVFWEQKYKLQKNMGYILNIWIGWHPYLLRRDNIVPISLRGLQIELLEVNCQKRHRLEKHSLDISTNKSTLANVFLE